MAYVVGDTKLIPQSAATADLTIDLSGLDVEVDDYVLIGVMCNAITGTLSETSGGGTTWDTTGTLNLSNASRMWLTWAKVAAGPTISNPTFHLSTGIGVWQGGIQIWRDADATTFKNGLATASTNTATSLASGTLTPSADNCAIVYFAGGHTSTNDPAILFKSDEVVGELIKNTQTDAYMSMAFGTVQQGSAAATAKTLYAGFAQRLLIITLAINNKSGGKLTRDSRAAMTRVNWFGKFGTAHESVTWDKLSTMVTWSSGLIDGITVNTAALGTVGTSIAVPPLWNEDTSIPFNANVTSEWVGAWATITGVTMTGKLFSLEWNLPALGGQIGSEGVIIALGDASGNAAVFRLAKKFSIEAGRRYTAFIDVDTATPLASVGTMNWANPVTKFGIGYHRVGSSGLTRNINFRNAFLHGTTDLVRGSAGAPQSIEYLDKVLNGWGYYGLCERLPNSKAVLVKTDVRFGDGTTETYLDATASMVAFPDDYSIETQPHWQVGANRIGLTLKGSATDTLDQVASSITGASQQNFTIDCHADADVSLSGTSIIGLAVTLDGDIQVASATISGCGEVAGSSADLTDVSITATASTDAAHSVTADGAVFTRTTIDGTGAAYAIELGTAVTAVTLTDCTITAGSTDKVHVLKTLTTVTAGSFVVGVHYKINTVGSTDFTLIGAPGNTIGVAFTATGIGSGTGTADQAVKITISGTTSLTEADVTTAGAAVWVAAPSPTLDATVLANTRVVLYNRTADAEISNTLVAGTSWTHTVTSGASSGDVLDLYTFKEGYAESVATIIYTGVDATFAVQQATDPAIQYYRTQESITDYTTLTEYNFYSPDIYIQADDADGENTLKKLFIFYNGVLTTEDGARYMRGGCTFRSAFDVVINRSSVAMAVDNVSVTHGLHFTDEDVIRVTTDDGTSWIAPPSAPGSIRYAFGVSPGQIETTGSSVITGTAAEIIAAIPSAATIANEVVNGVTFP